MATTFTATLILYDSGDVPTVSLVVQIDGATISHRALTPTEAVTALGILAPEAQAVWLPAHALVDRLEGSIATSAEVQAARADALAEWQAALAVADPGTNGAS